MRVVLLVVVAADSLVVAVDASGTTEVASRWFLRDKLRMLDG